MSTNRTVAKPSIRCAAEGPWRCKKHTQWMQRGGVCALCVEERLLVEKQHEEEEDGRILNGVNSADREDEQEISPHDHKSCRRIENVNVNHSCRRSSPAVVLLNFSDSSSAAADANASISSTPKLVLCSLNNTDDHQQAACDDRRIPPPTDDGGGSNSADHRRRRRQHITMDSSKLYPVDGSCDHVLFFCDLHAPCNHLHIHRFSQTQRRGLRRASGNLSRLSDLQKQQHDGARSPLGHAASMPHQTSSRHHHEFNPVVTYSASAAASPLFQSSARRSSARDIIANPGAVEFAAAASDSAASPFFVSPRRRLRNDDGCNDPGVVASSSSSMNSPSVLSARASNATDNINHPAAAPFGVSSGWSPLFHSATRSIASDCFYRQHRPDRESAAPDVDGPSNFTSSLSTIRSTSKQRLVSLEVNHHQHREYCSRRYTSVCAKDAHHLQTNNTAASGVTADHRERYYRSPTRTKSAVDRISANCDLKSKKNWTASRMFSWSFLNRHMNAKSDHLAKYVIANNDINDGAAPNHNSFHDASFVPMEFAMERHHSRRSHAADLEVKNGNIRLTAALASSSDAVEKDMKDMSDEHHYERQRRRRSWIASLLFATHRKARTNRCTAAMSGQSRQTMADKRSIRQQRDAAHDNNVDAFRAVQSYGRIEDSVYTKTSAQRNSMPTVMKNHSSDINSPWSSSNYSGALQRNSGASRKKLNLNPTKCSEEPRRFQINGDSWRQNSGGKEKMKTRGSGGHGATEEEAMRACNSDCSSSSRNSVNEMMKKKNRRMKQLIDMLAIGGRGRRNSEMEWGSPSSLSSLWYRWTTTTKMQQMSGGLPSSTAMVSGMASDASNSSSSSSTSTTTPSLITCASTRTIATYGDHHDDHRLQQQQHRDRNHHHHPIYHHHHQHRYPRQLYRI